MARTIADIKDTITADFMRNEDVAKAYGFNPGDSFSAHFSNGSVESVYFYIMAFSCWTMEQLFDAHKQEVETLAETIIPHRPKWYQAMTLKFMKDKVLIPDTDQYDTTGMSDEEIEAARVVKHAVADESEDASIVTIKVAGEQNGKRCRLPDEVEIQLAAYIKEFKDAGVRVSLVNIDPDVFNCEVDIYYDPMLLPETVKDNCETAIRHYIENLPFNGEYTNMALVDTLQKVEGVKIAEFLSASSAAHGLSTETVINARCVPEAGYFTPKTILINMKAYE